ncbi:MAG: helix-turn-helix transcriptional regulator, partial [Candidatus Omnitrophota bacterium]|nr:helix-turn-helix transcriptional regulator [Candidatus Omnitrophota bacterium]
DIEGVSDYKGDLSCKAVYIRICKAMANRKVTVKDIDRIKATRYHGISFHAFIYDSLKKGHMSSYQLDRYLEPLGRVLGIEPVWFRTGFRRAEWENDLPKKLPEKTIGERIEGFRLSEGLSQAQLAKRLGWSVHRIRILERVAERLPPHKYGLLMAGESWDDLANALCVNDAFLILAGYKKQDMAKRLLQKDAIRVCRIHKGETQSELAGYLNVSVTSIVNLETTNILPADISVCRKLAERYGFSVGELFKRRSFQCLRDFYENFKDSEISVNELRKYRKNKKGDLHSREHVYNELKRLIKIGLVQETERDRYALTEFVKELTVKQLNFVCDNMPELSLVHVKNSVIMHTKKSIYDNIKDLSRRRDGDIFFFGDEIKNSPANFKKAVKALRKRISVKVLAEDEAEKSELLPAFKNMGLTQCQVVTYREAHLTSDEAVSYRKQILGIDNMHCIINLPSAQMLSPLPRKPAISI